MLQRRSIRTKLIAALTLLSAIVCVLAFSGLWGLYRYRRLANAISQRAEELPDANELNRLAETLRDTNRRINELRQNEGMIDSGLEIQRVQQEADAFDHTLFKMGLTLDSYEGAIARSAEATTVLVDAARQSRELGAIRESIRDLKAFHENLSIDPSRNAVLQQKIDNLVLLTHEHLSLIHGNMAAFSHDVRGQYRKWIGVAWFCTILSIVMMGILLWSFSSLVVKPFRTLLDGSRLVAGGQFDHRIDLGTGDELSEMAVAMNDMTDRFQRAYDQVNTLCADLDQQVRDRTREVIQNEQLASVGFLAAGVAHEINNPLATIAWSAESLESRVDDLRSQNGDQQSPNSELTEALRTNLRRIQDEAFRCAGITEKLLDFSRLNEVRRAPANLGELVEEVVAMVGKVGKYRCKTIRTQCAPHVIAEINQQEIRQVVLNLVTNALESVDCDGAVDVLVGSDGVNASIVVKDNGCGMTSEVLQHLFEPFFTRRRDGTGTGLGLSITYRIISQHGGSLTAHSDGDGCGSSMEILLPIGSNREETATASLNSLGLNTLKWNHDKK